MPGRFIEAEQITRPGGRLTQPQTCASGMKAKIDHADRPGIPGPSRSSAGGRFRMVGQAVAGDPSITRVAMCRNRRQAKPEAGNGKGRPWQAGGAPLMRSIRTPAARISRNLSSSRMNREYDSSRQDTITFADRREKFHTPFCQGKLCKAAPAGSVSCTTTLPSVREGPDVTSFQSGRLRPRRNNRLEKHQRTGSAPAISRSCFQAPTTGCRNDGVYTRTEYHRCCRGQRLSAADGRPEMIKIFNAIGPRRCGHGKLWRPSAVAEIWAQPAFWFPRGNSPYGFNRQQVGLVERP